MCLIKVEEDLWILEGDRVKMLSIPFTTRMTIVRLRDNRLWLHSPIALTTERLTKISELGKVAHIIAPNKLHHLFVGEWISKYPNAKLWGAQGLPEKRQDLKFDGVLNDSAEPEWNNEIDQLYFQGSNMLPEMVFLHRQSKTLIITDLIQNHDPVIENWFWKFIKKVNGILSPNGGVPKDLRMTIRDKEKARKSLQKMLSWDFDRLIISHGLCIEKNAKKYVLDSFSWLMS
ncbi:MAG: DUF4336 domain-containing protein [Cyanobacteria bacterium P01_F01_bin.143]